MSEHHDVDLRAAINAISDVIQNRPRPLRNFDQIYMKAGDMVLQSEMVARWADEKRLAFMGDGDSISVCVAYLRQAGILRYGPKDIMVYDFDERVLKAAERFAEKQGITNLKVTLYNVIDPFVGPVDFDCFYTNPPWGASNGGESVKIFVQRGMEATSHAGDGMVVIADDPDLHWPKEVLANVQRYALSSGFFVQKMQSQLHSYHLDDAPNLKSCNLILRALSGNRRETRSLSIGGDQLNNFYGRDNRVVPRYVREKARVDYGKAHDDEYFIETLERDCDGEHD
jgi:N4-bis(aminopropyl)spermidine synthase